MAYTLQFLGELCQAVPCYELGFVPDQRSGVRAVPVGRLNGSEFHDLAGDILDSGHLLRFQASGSSMQPFIHDGDILRWPHCQESTQRPVAFVGRESPMAFSAGTPGCKNKEPRKVQLAILIKGDACSCPDGWFILDDVRSRSDCAT